MSLSIASAIMEDLQWWEIHSLPRLSFHLGTGFSIQNLKSTSAVGSFQPFLPVLSSEAKHNKAYPSPTRTILQIHDGSSHILPPTQVFPSGTATPPIFSSDFYRTWPPTVAGVLWTTLQIPLVLLSPKMAPELNLPVEENQKWVSCPDRPASAPKEEAHVPC